MKFNEQALIIFETATKELKKLENILDEESKKMDKEWLDKMNTELSTISSNTFYANAKTVGDVVRHAKQERNQVLEKLRNCYDTEKQLKLTSRLLELNKLIVAQEKAEMEKENKKYDNAKNKKTVIIRSLLDQLIENVEKEIKALKDEVIENSSKIVEAVGNKNLKEYTDSIKKNNKKIMELVELKKALNELKNYNGNIYSTEYIKNLSSMLIKEYADLVKDCYSLITKNNINMKTVIVSKDEDSKDEDSKDEDPKDEDAKDDNPKDEDPKDEDAKDEDAKDDDPKDEDSKDKMQEKIKEINKLLEEAEKSLSEKALEEACILIKSLPEGEDKNKLIARVKEIFEKINAHNNKDVKEATTLVEEAEIMGKYPVVKGTNKKIQEAILKINELPEGEIRDSLSERINNLIKIMTDIFKAEVVRIEEKFKNKEEVSEKEITDLRDTFEELPEKLPKLSFSKAGKEGYGIQMMNLIEIYNAQNQSSLTKTSKELDEDSNDSFKEKMFDKIYSFKEKFLEFGPHWLIKLKGKVVDKIEDKLYDARQSGDTDLIGKYEDMYKGYVPFQQERDVVNGVKLFANQETLNKLKNVNLDKKQSNKIFKAIKNIGSIELRGLTKCTKDRRAAYNKDRVYTVIKQYIELLSIVHDYQKYKENWYERAQEIEMKEKVKADAIAFINDAYSSKTISKAEYKAYMEAINFICKYRKYSKNNDIYRINYDEDGKLVNINDAVEYYKNPVSYTDKDSDGKEVIVDLPHIMRK